MTTRLSTLSTASGSVELPGSLRLTVHRPAPGTAVVEVDGDLDLATAPRLHELIAATASGALIRLVLDLRGVQFLSATGLAAVEHGYLLAAERGIACAVRVHPAGRALRVIRLLPLRFAEALEPG
ncbi:STAS domain-containing protein [Amycolatopsis sp. NPDC005003]